MESTFVFYLSDTLSGVVQFDLLGLDEHAQFLVGEHGNRSQNCAFDEIERQNPKQQIALHAGHIRVDSIARIKDSLQGITCE